MAEEKETTETPKCKPIKDMTREDFLFFDVPCSDPGSFEPLRGCRSYREGYIYKNIDFNKFEEEDSKIPDNARPEDREFSDEWLRDYFWCPDKTKVERDPSLFPKDADAYRIEDNGGMPFVVYVTKDDVTVYRIPAQGYVEGDDWEEEFDLDRLFYTEIVYQFDRPVKTWIGQDDNDEEHGNSILVQETETQYTYVGSEIYSFSLPEQVTAYYSAMGNSSVPYPVAVTEKWAVFMLDAVRCSREEMLTLHKEKYPDEDWGSWSDAYTPFYRLHPPQVPLENHSLIQESVI